MIFIIITLHFSPSFFFFYFCGRRVSRNYVTGYIKAEVSLRNIFESFTRLFAPLFIFFLTEKTSWSCCFVGKEGKNSTGQRIKVHSRLEPWPNQADIFGKRASRYLFDVVSRIRNTLIYFILISDFSAGFFFFLFCSPWDTKLRVWPLTWWHRW